MVAGEVEEEEEEAVAEVVEEVVVLEVEEEEVGASEEEEEEAADSEEGDIRCPVGRPDHFCFRCVACLCCGWRLSGAVLRVPFCQWNWIASIESDPGEQDSQFCSEGGEPLLCTVSGTLWVLKEPWDFSFEAYLDFLNKIFNFLNLCLLNQIYFLKFEGLKVF